MIKSLRASDPDAALYYAARMLDAGEDALFLARRLVIFASEDIGNAEPQALSVAAVCLVILSFMSWRRVSTVASYILVGVIMWIAVLKSGVHATLAGVALAAFIPMRDSKDSSKSPLRLLEHDLHSVVAYGVLPMFAFVNGGIDLAGVSIESMMHSVPLGIATGLFVGKQVGIFLLCFLAIKLGMARMPEGANWGSLYGVSVLCGVGFTMSLFVGSLAFENVLFSPEQVFDERLGIIVGSILSAVVGFLVLHMSLPKPR
jgi:NhaA family Na+:H+ antiporter